MCSTLSTMPDLVTSSPASCDPCSWNLQNLCPVWYLRIPPSVPGFLAILSHLRHRTRFLKKKACSSERFSQPLGKAQYLVQVSQGNANGRMPLAECCGRGFNAGENRLTKKRGFVAHNGINSSGKNHPAPVW